MQEWLKTLLVYLGAALSGSGLATIIVLLLKKFIVKKINEFVERILEPKAKEVMPNEKLERIEKNTADIKKEILEMRGKRK